MTSKTKRKLPPATDWQSRELSDWTAGTFRAYLSDQHREILNISYVTRNYAVDAKLINAMRKENGNDATKRFIDACFRSYTPTPNYPGVNFTFMYAYMREGELPKILADIKREQEREQRMMEQDNVDTAEIIEWL